jgi:putative acyl-CoA dehydrogenase
MARQPESVEVFLDELDAGAGADSRLDAAVSRLRHQLVDLADLEYRARFIVESMAKVLQGTLLVRHGHPAVADAFCASRLGGEWGAEFGTLPTGVDTSAILERARPKL